MLSKGHPVSHQIGIAKEAVTVAHCFIDSHAASSQTTKQFSSSQRVSQAQRGCSPVRSPDMFFCRRPERWRMDVSCPLKHFIDSSPTASPRHVIHSPMLVSWTSGESLTSGESRTSSGAARCFRSFDFCPQSQMS